jgi:hypothetical protein
LRGRNSLKATWTFGLYNNIVDERAQNGLCSIKPSYLGDPLVSKDIVRALKYARIRVYWI